MIDFVKVTITPTADKKNFYVQVISADQMSLNFVVVAKKIEVLDMVTKTVENPPPRGEGG